MPLPNLKSLFTGGASKLIDSVKGVISEFHLSPEDKLKAEAEITKIANEHLLNMEQELTKQMVSEDQAITERWKADSESDSKLSKNTRPLGFLSLLGFTFLIIICDSLNIQFEVKESYVTLLETLLITTTVAYYGSRGVEKFKTIHESAKRK